MSDEYVKENPRSMRRYAKHWRTISVATPSWQTLGFNKRLIITEDLMRKVQKHKCGFAPLRAIIDRRHMENRYNLAAVWIANDPLREENAAEISHAASPYLALYYSRVSGGFCIDNFVPQYKAANSF